MKSFLRWNLRHRTLLLALLVTETNLRVSALSPHDWGRRSRERLFFSSSVESPVNAKVELIERGEASGGMYR